VKRGGVENGSRAPDRHARSAWTSRSRRR